MAILSLIPKVNNISETEINNNIVVANMLFFIFKIIPLFIFYTLAIWACYFFHFYFTFYCFAFTAHLGMMAALVMFVGGTFAVIVPTPNGAGPWHFAVISMMMLYGVNVTNAGIFALIVHGIQTFLVVLLGIYGLAALPFTNRQRK
mgnify:CR=1 FL=1